MSHDKLSVVYVTNVHKQRASYNAESSIRGQFLVTGPHSPRLCTRASRSAAPTPDLQECPEDQGEDIGGYL